MAEPMDSRRDGQDGGVINSRRPDGREDNELRPPSCELGALSRADGSASFGLGGTTMLASVHGPGPVSVRDEHANRATLEVTYRPKTGVGGIGARRMEEALTHALAACVLLREHPRSGISIVIQEISSDGGLLACALNAACLALIDAGVPLRATAAATAVLVRSDGGLALDPTADEASSPEARGVLTYGVTNASAAAGASANAGGVTAGAITAGGKEEKVLNVILAETVGCCSPQQAQLALGHAHAAARSVLAFYRKAIERRLSKDSTLMAASCKSK